MRWPTCRTTRGDYPCWGPAAHGRAAWASSLGRSWAERLEGHGGGRAGEEPGPRHVSHWGHADAWVVLGVALELRRVGEESNQ